MPENDQHQSGGVPFSRGLRDVSLAFGSFIVAIGVMAWMGTMPSVDAYVGPRPTVELVKVFQCNAGFSDSIDSCGARLESKINDWLQKIQPNARILARVLTATDGNIVLMVFYEVPEWRTPAAPQQKLPAERP